MISIDSTDSNLPSIRLEYLNGNVHHLYLGSLGQGMYLRFEGVLFKKIDYYGKSYREVRDESN